MNIHTLKLGELETNCYILEDGKDAIIIDPADNFEVIKKFVSELNVVEILVTHHHFDHVGALEECEKEYNLKHNNYGSSKFKYEVIQTPGHTDDLVTFYFKDINSMFCGDFIFENSIGRFDFPNSSLEDMIKSLNKITKYDEGIVLYPGHGNKTTLGKEKVNFKCYL